MSTQATSQEINHLERGVCDPLCLCRVGTSMEGTHCARYVRQHCGGQRNKLKIRWRDPLQLIFLTAALYDIEVSSKDNWIADALSHFEIHKIADLFPQFSQIKNSGFHPHWTTGKPMSALQEKLQTFFGMDSLLMRVS